MPDALRHIFVIQPPADCPAHVSPAGVLMDHGAADLAALAAATQPDDIATLIYTSGTTGPPKGVMISQYNVVYTVESLRRCIDFQTFAGKRVVSYLPMAHIAERMMSHYQQAVLGYTVHCCSNPNDLPRYLGLVRPELIFGVPRVWEKIYNGVNAALSAKPDDKAQFDDGVAAAMAIKQAERDGSVTQVRVSLRRQVRCSSPFAWSRFLLPGSIVTQRAEAKKRSLSALLEGPRGILDGLHGRFGAFPADEIEVLVLKLVGRLEELFNLLPDRL